jgi:cytidine deaminase
VTRPSQEELDALVVAAAEVRERAYAPYSGFSVGAAVLAHERVFTGTNVEIASYPISVCAERSAISAMVAAGERTIDAIALVTDADEPTTPCGGCRQALWEFGREAVVVCATTDGTWNESSMRELLPRAFGPESFLPETSQPA